jgi:CubicO group peptidase (beta-lactamase class C family)
MPLTMVALGCAPLPSPRHPTAVTMLETDWQPVTAFLDSAVSAGAAPGAVLGVSVAGNRFIHATGHLEPGGSIRAVPTTVYDLASLTKVIGLATAAMLAVDDGRIELDVPVQRYLPAFGGPGKEPVTVRMLLAHAGGVPGWRPLFREATSRAEAFALAHSTPLDSVPGASSVYSDLGAIVLTQLIESVYHQRLDSLLERRVFQPLGMTSVRFNPPAEEWELIAPTEFDPRRGRMLRGEVHDENAAAMNGVSGHAGLFGNVPDVLTFAEWMLGQADGWTGGQPVRPSIVREFTRRQGLVPGSSRALGWDTPEPGGSAGRFLSSQSFGHTGFTGTSLWIDPERELAIVLLSNRVNPTRDNPRWAPVRARVADLVVTTLFEDAP